MRRVIVGAVCLVLAATAGAAGAAPTPICREDGSTQELNACAYQQFEQADKVLNQAYKSVLAALPAGRREALRVEQRAWLKKRDASCKDDVVEMVGKSGYVVELQSCRTAATEDRTRAIRAWK